MLRYILSLYLIIFLNSVLFTVSETNSGVLLRSKRFLFLFPFYRILPGTSCVGSTNLQGICLTQRQCTARGGTCSGSCASSKGVCCVYQRTCGQSTNGNLTYFVNPGFPSSTSTGVQCSITINKINAGVCQLRIDFLDMTIAEPNGNGACNNDFLNIGTNLPRICGENTGQHVYLNFPGNSYGLTVDTLNSLAMNRRWNLLITQIPCNSTVRAPVGCLKYYTGTQGSDYSFNYAPTPSTSGGSGNRQLAGLNVGVCVRPETGFCSIEWTQATGDFSFTVSGDSSVSPPTESTGTSCTTNFIVIPNPSTGSPFTPQVFDRFCGNALTPVRTMSRPFVLTYVTSSVVSANDKQNRGYHLNFNQIACARNR